MLAWVGLPHFQTPEFHLGVVGLFVPVVLVLVAENIGHVKSVSAMTGQNLDGVSGRALLADGVATMLAGLGGGSGTTTYAENIGVMAATKVYSTAAYWVAGVFAVVLSFSPKFGELIATVPAGVLGGAATMLYGMIGVLGVKIWVQNKVNFSNSINLTTAAVALIIGIAELHVDRRRPDVQRHRAGLGRGPGDLPRHEGDREGARHGGGARNGRAGAARGGDGSSQGRREARPEEATLAATRAGPEPQARSAPRRLPGPGW